MLDPIDDAGLFLIQTLFNLYISIVLLRVVLQHIGVDFFNPITQFVVKMTNPILVPMRRIVPPLKTIDTTAILLLLILEMLKLTAIVWLKAGIFPDLLGLMIWSFGSLLDQLVDIFFYAILAVIILSWINPSAHSPVVEILYRLTGPLLQKAHKLMPPISGFDLSPILVLIFLKVLGILLVHPIENMGSAMAMLNVD